MTRDGLDERLYYAKTDIKADKAAQEKARDATARDIRQDARLQMLRRLSPARRKNACRLDELHAYLDRERVRRAKYIRSHLSGGDRT